MTLKVISAQSIVYQGEVESVTLPGEVGAFTVLPGHATLISSLLKGKIAYTAGGERHEQEIAGGVVDVDRDVISVCIY
ncbi:MAG: F0F1 ATP synthase subunit epsilon [Bacteroidales bacterium]|nr:F0F1 ATP synthase subunit epsilon [Bacteroidales bacterium]